MALEYVSVVAFISLTLTNDIQSIGFIVTKITPNLNTSLGYKMFLLFATINIGGMAVFSLYDLITLTS